MSLKISLSIVVASLVCACGSLQQSSVLHSLYLIICKPTPEQQAVAQKNVDTYLSRSRRSKTPPKNRYVAVQTLNPVVGQKLAYVSKKTKVQIDAEKKGEKLPASWVDTDKLRCIMVFDTQSRQFVGSGCYVVGSLPSNGQLVEFESVTAEFVSSGQTQF